jgi:hypothetical protein
MLDQERAAEYRERHRQYEAATRRERGVAPLSLQQRRVVPLPRPDVEELDTGPIMMWLLAWRAAHPDDSTAALCTRTGVEGIRRASHELEQGTRKSIPLDFVDRILVQAGEVPDTLHALYPIDVLDDDGTGHFGLPRFGGQPGARFVLVVPEPATPLMRPERPHDSPWEPRWELWPTEHRAVLRRIRAELGIAQPWRKHSIKWRNEQKVAA